MAVFFPLLTHIHLFLGECGEERWLPQGLGAQPQGMREALTHIST